MNCLTHMTLPQKQNAKKVFRREVFAPAAQEKQSVRRLSLDESYRLQ